MLSMYLKERVKLFLNKLRNKIRNSKIVSNLGQSLSDSIYNYEKASNFYDFDNIVSFSDKDYWYCIGIKIEEEEELLILHTKSNIIFNKKLKLIGLVLKENDRLYLLELEDIQNSDYGIMLIEWYNKCLEKTLKEIKEIDIN